jgi:uncharacterized repeat protein (TIGR02543 family)
MKKLSSILLSLTALVIIMGLSFACQSCQKPDPTPVPNPTAYTVSFNANGGTGSVASQTVNSGSSITLPSNSFSYTGYTFVSWNTNQSGTGTSYNAGASYTVTSNVTLYAIWQQNAPTYTAVFTAVDASTTATLKSLPGNSVAKALVLNVATAGTVKLETIGTLNNSNPAIGYYWITSKDSADVNQATSTLNPILAKTAITASQTITLSTGINVICFKTAALNGAITNGTAIGLKVTGANSNVVSNASYTADATSANVANVVKIFSNLNNNVVISPNVQTTGTVFSYLTVVPYNNETATTYDGTLYPSILSVSYDIKNVTWFTGTTTGYSNLDFTNALGSAGQNLNVSQDNSGTNSWIFTNSQANLSSGILQFSINTGVKLVKSILGNYAYCSAAANVYNSTSTQVGSMSVCWYLKSIRFVGNPELWVYAPDGTRIW